jgi:hypothetical protein
MFRNAIFLRSVLAEIRVLRLCTEARWPRNLVNRNETPEGRDEFRRKISRERWGARMTEKIYLKFNSAVGIDPLPKIRLITEELSLQVDEVVQEEPQAGKKLKLVVISGDRGNIGREQGNLRTCQADAPDTGRDREDRLMAIAARGSLTLL